MRLSFVLIPSRPRRMSARWRGGLSWRGGGGTSVFHIALLYMLLYELITILAALVFLAKLDECHGHCDG